VGNFFTPRRVVRFIVDAIGVSPSDSLIDPACGTGGFPVWAWRRVIEHLNADPSLTEAARQAQAQGFADRLYACDELQEAVDLAKANLALHGVRPSAGYRDHIRRHDGLYSGVLRRGVDDGRFDGAAEGSFTAVACNPPFGAGERAVRDGRILGLFELGRGRASARIEYLFLERAIRLLAPTGRLGIIMPEGLLSAIGDDAVHARDFLLTHVRVVAVVQIPRSVWRTTDSTVETNASVILGVRKRRAFDQETPILMTSAADVDAVDPLASDDLQAILPAVSQSFQDVGV
jgi:type I restriction enzyme M protein